MKFEQNNNSWAQSLKERSRIWYSVLLGDTRTKCKMDHWGQFIFIFILLSLLTPYHKHSISCYLIGLFSYIQTSKVVGDAVQSVVQIDKRTDRRRDRWTDTCSWNPSVLFWPLVCNRQRALCGRGLVWVMTTWLLWIMPWLLWYCGLVEGRPDWWPELWEECGLYWGWFPDEDRTMGRPELVYPCPGAAWPAMQKDKLFYDKLVRCVVYLMLHD